MRCRRIGGVPQQTRRVPRLRPFPPRRTSCSVLWRRNQEVRLVRQRWEGATDRFSDGLGTRRDDRCRAASPALRRLIVPAMRQRCRLCIARHSKEITGGQMPCPGKREFPRPRPRHDPDAAVSARGGALSAPPPTMRRRPSDRTRADVRSTRDALRSIGLASCTPLSPGGMLVKFGLSHLSGDPTWQ
jgi:hypothetical protein